jgi:hypothetical protein
VVVLVLIEAVDELVVLTVELVVVTTAELVDLDVMVDVVVAAPDIISNKH